jgi:hypothetical protein
MAKEAAMKARSFMDGGEPQGWLRSHRIGLREARTLPRTRDRQR